MVTKSEWLFEGIAPKTDRQVRHHFEEMIRRNCDRLADHSAVDYGRHLLNFALASAPPSAPAKNLALLAAGWYRVAGGVGLDCSKAKWHRPSLDFKRSYCRYSEAKTKKQAVTLDVAWEEHENEIREAIEEAWIPTTGMEQVETIGEEEEEEEDIPDDEENVSKQEGDDNGHGTQEEETKTCEASSDRVVMVGVEPKKLESSEHADWSHFGRLLKDRKGVVQMGDPRPSLNCRWCGARPFDTDCYETKSIEQIFEYREVPATCRACKYLEKLGWKLHFTVKIFSAKKRKSSDRQFKGAIKVIPPDGKSVESVKEFLRVSTSLVSEEFSKSASSTPIADNVNQKLSPNPSESSSEFVQATSTADEAKQKGGNANRSGDGNDKYDEAPKTLHKLRPQTRIIKPALPTFDHLLTLERGLVSVLASDDLHFWNAHYGTNSTVALCTLRPLANG